jgi:hypothetical protein
MLFRLSSLPLLLRIVDLPDSEGQRARRGNFPPLAAFGRAFGYFQQESAALLVGTRRFS